MMTTIGNSATGKVIQMITGSAGVNSGLAALTAQGSTPASQLDTA